MIEIAVILNTVYIFIIAPSVILVMMAASRRLHNNGGYNLAKSAMYGYIAALITIFFSLVFGVVGGSDVVSTVLRIACFFMAIGGLLSLDHGLVSWPKLNNEERAKIAEQQKIIDELNNLTNSDRLRDR